MQDIDNKTYQMSSNAGYQHLLSGEFEEALGHFLHALRLSPGNSVIFNKMGNALLNLNRLDEAQRPYQEAIERRPDFLRPYRNLALLLQLWGRTDEAIDAYSRYLGRAPEDGQAHHILGLLYISKGLTEQANASFE